MTQAWDWVVAAYERPGVAAACLALQDEQGQCVSFLLWAAWAGAQDPGALAAAAAFARDWDGSAIAPLRLVRRRLKAAFPPVTKTHREALREQLKAAELRGEQALVEALAAFAVRGDGDVAPLTVLEAAAQAWNGSPPGAALAALAAGLE